ncbi:MAG: acetoacetate decarboxylase family protein [Hyphomicrobium sp.]
MGCKLIPGVGGKPGICQLVTYNVTEIIVKGSWIGPGRLHLVSHVNAPVAARAAHHRRPTLPYGCVLHNYLQEGRAGAFRKRALVPLPRHAVEQCG